jgi:hypothetical protein
MHIYIYVYIPDIYLYVYFADSSKSGAAVAGIAGEASSVSLRSLGFEIEESPDHRHRNLKAFREQIQIPVLYCFITVRYL